MVLTSHFSQIQCFITDNAMALEELYGNEVMTRKGDECLNLMANRIATVFASLLVCNFVLFLFVNLPF